MSTSRERGARGQRQTQSAKPAPKVYHLPLGIEVREDFDVTEVAGGGVLTLGVPLLKWLSVAEHADFLMTVTNHVFQGGASAWTSWGWIALTILGLIFIVRGLRTPRSQSGQIGLEPLISFSLFTFLLGSLLTITSQSAFPQIIVAHSANYTCSAQLDGSKLVSFSGRYNVGLLCALDAPNTDVFSTHNIIVSNDFEITNTTMTIDAGRGFTFQNTPTGQSPPTGATVLGAAQPGQTITMQVTEEFFPILIPKDVPTSQITSLSQLCQLGGKIMDERYFR